MDDLVAMLKADVESIFWVLHRRHPDLNGDLALLMNWVRERGVLCPQVEQFAYVYGLACEWAQERVVRMVPLIQVLRACQVGGPSRPDLEAVTRRHTRPYDRSADEVISDVWMRVRRTPTDKLPASELHARNWFRRTAVHCSIDFRRLSSREAAHHAVGFPLEMIAENENEVSPFDQETLANLTHCMNGLSEQEREVVRGVLEARPLSSVAETYKVSVRTVQRWRTDILLKLKKCLENRTLASAQKR